MSAVRRDGDKFALLWLLPAATLLWLFIDVVVEADDGSIIWLKINKLQKHKKDVT